MKKTSIITDLDQCRVLWKRLLSPVNISDFWEFRRCFHRRFKTRPSFFVREDHRGIFALLPLSYLEEEETFVFFPGETWKGRTWMERTPFFLREDKQLSDLLEICPDRTHLRYMEVSGPSSDIQMDGDEIGYVLYPGAFGFNLTRYTQRFSNKKLKSLQKTIRSLVGDRPAIHLNRLKDYNVLVDMNVGRFGEDSYLYDDRFRESFRDVMDFLFRKGLLRMVSLELGGKILAVDLGAIYRGTYTVFLGGTHPDAPGIAKVMNMHHIEFAFNEGLTKIDFLCGDFHWKKLWHLDPEPLCRYVSPALTSGISMDHLLIPEAPDYISSLRVHA